ncbi:MAG: hypothetical protein AAFX39_16970 [Pseudomonadota bacterium]
MTERADRKMQDHVRLGLETYHDMTKQVITLSTGVIAFLIALDTVFFDASLRATGLYFVAVGLFCGSILFGLLTVGRIVSLCSSPDTTLPDDALSALARIQHGCFFLGCACLAYWFWTQA